ncbi:serine hydrolase domain-containing protein [Roseivirga sp. 4D4]|uniref:serine hydrolase domain-containing protein n=1 Tax=Roseivirga sp. 4D4 TaxID=1889784 RepID=UPI00147E1A08|nr:serine hydrolase domain-containing protein [Roseivirga sp. 4D4]
MRKIALTLTILTLALAVLRSQTTNPLSSKAALEAYLETQQFSGAILTVDSESNQMIAATGFGDLDNTKSLDPDSRFKIASITKLFTAVIIMQLIAEEKIALNTKVGSLLPNLEITNAHQITIKHLLQHTTGLKKESHISYLSANSPEENISKFASKKAKFAPGADINYNNVDYLILGKVIEQVAGRSYLTELNERIITPLEMSNTGLLVEKELPADVIPSFEIKRGSKKPELNIHIQNFWAAGSMFSTVSDLLKFTKALKGDSLLGKEAKKSLFESKPSLGYAALGCWTFNSPFITGKPRVMERRGGIMGSNSVLITSLDGPETLIVLSNTDQFDPNTFGQSDNMKEYLFKTLFTVND